LGDYDPIEHGPSVDYLRDFDFAPSQSDDLLEKIMEIHRTTLKGQSPAEAGKFVPSIPRNVTVFIKNSMYIIQNRRWVKYAEIVRAELRLSYALF
jgi:hypothetical protein